MKELKELFGKILNYINVYGQEADELAKLFFDQVYAIFVESILKTEMSDETFKYRIAEYQNYIKEGKHELVHEDIKHYMNKESAKLLGESFLKHLKFFMTGLKERGDVTEAQMKEVGEIIKTFVQNKKAVSRMQDNQFTDLPSANADMPMVNPISAQTSKDRMAGGEALQSLIN